MPFAIKNQRLTRRGLTRRGWVRRGWVRGWCLLAFCLLVVDAMQEARCEERQHSRPEPLGNFDERQLQQSFAEGIDFLVSSQRGDGGWGGPQWTGGVDSDPVPGSFRSFDIAVTAINGAMTTGILMTMEGRPLTELMQATMIRKPPVHVVGGAQEYVLNQHANQQFVSDALHNWLENMNQQ